MRPDSAVSAQLRALAVAAESDADLEQTLQRFLDSLMGAYPATSAVSVTVHRHGLPITVAADTVAAPGTQSEQLTVHLPRRAVGERTAVLQITSADPAGLRQVRADLLGLLDLDPRRATLETSRPEDPDEGPAQADGGDAAGDVSTVDRALGVLLDRGLLPAQALAELTARGTLHEENLPAAARRVIAELRQTPR